MEKRQIIDALEGRVSPFVVDAFVARAVSRSDSTDIVFLPASDASPRSVPSAQRVALPVKSKSGWTLVIANSATRDATVFTSVRAEGCVCVGCGREPGDGGIEMLSWVTELLSRGCIPPDGGDTLVVRLELTVMMQLSARVTLRTDIPYTRVIETDLSNHVCISDDTVDFCLARVQRMADPRRIQILKCGEVKAWAGARGVVSMEAPGEARAKMQDAYRNTVQEQLNKSEITLLPVHGGAHWCLVSISKDSVRVMDSMGRSGIEYALLDALRWLYPQIPHNVIVETVAQQSDAVSCGIFTIAFAEAIVSSKDEWVLPRTLNARDVRARLRRDAAV